MFQEGFLFFITRALLQLSWEDSAHQTYEQCRCEKRVPV